MKSPSSSQKNRPRTETDTSEYDADAAFEEFLNSMPESEIMESYKEVTEALAAGEALLNNVPSCTKKVNKRRGLRKASFPNDTDSDDSDSSGINSSRKPRYNIDDIDDSDSEPFVSTKKYSMSHRLYGFDNMWSGKTKKTKLTRRKGPFIFGADGEDSDGKSSIDDAQDILPFRKVHINIVVSIYL